MFSHEAEKLVSIDSETADQLDVMSFSVPARLACVIAIRTSDVELILVSVKGFDLLYLTCLETLVHGLFLPSKSPWFVISSVNRWTCCS